MEISRHAFTVRNTYRAEVAEPTGYVKKNETGWDMLERRKLSNALTRFNPKENGVQYRHDVERQRRRKDQTEHNYRRHGIEERILQ